MNLCHADKLLLGGAGTVLASSIALGVTPLSIGVPAAILAGLIADGVARPGSSLLYPTISKGPSHRPCIALTFDDGPDAEVTPDVLDTLAKFEARATFFAIGRNIEQHRAVAQRIVSEHHELGNHSWQHSRMQNFYSRRRQAADLARSSQQIREITGARAEPLYRPPIGLKSPPLARAAQKLGLKMIAWSLHGHDTRQDDPQRIAAGVLARITAGDIVLLHDGHDIPGHHRVAGARALPLILQGLKERGLRAVTVSELLGFNTPAAGST
jgi:peptidoglycan/xylan/chitin deacetylase (PgdA/CDA1 family)